MTHRRYTADPWGRAAARRALPLIAVLALVTALTGVAAPQSARAASTHPQARRACADARPGHARCRLLVRTGPAGTAEPRAAAEPPAGYGPADLRKAYNPSGASDGAVVAVVDAYDDPNAALDLAVYRAEYGLPPCTEASGCLTKVNQRGRADGYPAPDDGWAREISTGLDMVSALCDDCRILLVEADSDRSDDLGAAVNTAVSLGARYVATGYGAPEDPSELALDEKYYDHPGVLITAAAGDDGYGTSYPAASQYVLAVGGTTLTRKSDPDPRGWTETAWGDATGRNAGTGSGCSTVEPKPSWQKDTGCPGRMMNDLAAVADPATGVAVYDSYGDQDTKGWSVAGGTGTAAVIVAATAVHAGPAWPSSRPASFPYLSGRLGLTWDVGAGANGSCDGSAAYFCTAQKGYDGPTGLGTPKSTIAFTDRVVAHGLMTVTQPPAQTGRVGTPVSLQIKAKGMWSNKLGYAATGLPPGLSIDPATGLISGTPTAWGTWTTSVNVQDFHRHDLGVSFAWRVTTAGGCYPGRLLGNQGFETGTPGPWTATGAWTFDTVNPAHTGHYSAYFDKNRATGPSDTLSQTVAIPAGCTSYRLDYWLWPSSDLPPADPAQDFLRVRLLDASGKVLTTLATYSNRDDTDHFVPRSVDLSAYAGQTVVLAFTTDSAADETDFALDDVTLTIG
ncbi:putative Ig domain-containing protein [Kitasatospora sp. HPMI-4]|uniref:putative Ig domain-containing protein n=1 Tax=Kitasatospora sp. HPMI-4 TaxID=3448443 RepID=UPI003F19FF7D